MKTETRADSIVVLTPDALPSFEDRDDTLLADTIEKVSARTPAAVVLDLTNIEKIDGVGWDHLLKGRRLLLSEIDMHLCGLSGDDRREFLGLGLDALFPVHRDRAQAIAAARYKAKSVRADRDAR